MKFLTSLVCLQMFVLLISCDSFSNCASNKEAYLDNVNAFIKEVSQKSEKESISDWTSYDKKLEQFTGECFDKYETELSNSDKANIAVATGSYLYAKYGLRAVMELGKQQESIQRAIEAVDPVLLLKVAVEVLKNPEEIKNIMKDLESRYK